MEFRKKPETELFVRCQIRVTAYCVRDSVLLHIGAEIKEVMRTANSTCR